MERTKLRTQRSDEIAKKKGRYALNFLENTRVFRSFTLKAYSGPSDMYKALNKARTTEENEARVNEIENRLTGLIEILESNPTSDTKKLETELIY